MDDQRDYEIKILEDARWTSRALCWLLHIHHKFGFTQYKKLCDREHQKQMKQLQAHLNNSPLASMISDPIFDPSKKNLPPSRPPQSAKVNSAVGLTRAGHAANDVFERQLLELMKKCEFDFSRLKTGDLKNLARIIEKIDEGRDVSDVNRASILCETPKDFELVLKNLEKYFKVYEYENKFTDKINVPPCLCFKVTFLEGSIAPESDIGIFIKDIGAWTMELQVMTNFIYIFGQETHGAYEIRRCKKAPQKCTFNFCDHKTIYWRQPISVWSVFLSDHPFETAVGFRTDVLLPKLFQQAKAFQVSEDDLHCSEPFADFLRPEDYKYPAWFYLFGLGISGCFCALIGYKLSSANDMLQCVDAEAQLQEVIFNTQRIPHCPEKQPLLSSVRKWQNINLRQAKKVEDWKMYTKCYVPSGKFRVVTLAAMLCVSRSIHKWCSEIRYQRR